MYSSAFTENYCRSSRKSYAPECCVDRTLSFRFLSIGTKYDFQVWATFYIQRLKKTVLNMSVWFCYLSQKLLTDRLALLAHSVCMRPSVQGLLWDEFDGLSEDKLKILFFSELMIWCSGCDFIFSPWAPNLYKFLYVNDDRSPDCFHA